MYEFTKKEIRKQFKETEYGKKVNSWLYISLAIFLTLLIVVPFLAGFALGFSGVEWEKAEEILMDYAELYGAIVFVSAFITMYFDGKRDGAIEQFKKNLNK